MNDLLNSQVLVFDLDGTLYDYDGCDQKGYEDVRKFLDHSGLFRSDEFYDLLKMGKHFIKKNTEQIASSHNRVLYFKEMSERIAEIKYIKSPARLALDLYDIYKKGFYKNIKPYEWVKPFLKSNKDKYKFVILTNMMALDQLEKLNRLGISEYFSKIFTSEELGYEKPELATYEFCIDYFRKRNPEFKPSYDITFIGDDYINDVKTPAMMGLKSVKVEDFVKLIGG